MINEVSIIINGVRYDAVTPKYADNSCIECDLKEFCENTALNDYPCTAMIGNHRCFKVSEKSFEP